MSFALLSLLSVGLGQVDDVKITSEIVTVTTKIQFKADAVGKLPPHWTAAKTGEGEGSAWKVVADTSTPSKSGFALAQTAAGPNALYNVCVFAEKRGPDVELSVMMKPMAGKLDQGGGLVWRYQDANNYYVARFNPLENNFRVYKVVAGKRVQLQTKEEIKYQKDMWVKVAITMTGDAITCSLDGVKHLEAKDDTFKQAGQVGLWTKADAQSRFDEFQVKVRK